MPLLQTRKLTAFYGDFQALYGVDTRLEASETIAIIGANGAGKSTFLKAIAGLIHGPADSVSLDGTPIGAKPAADIVKLGIALVPEGRRLFPSLTVEENLLIGGYGRKMRGPWTLDRVYGAVSDAEGAATRGDAGPVGRTAADGRDRPCSDVQSARAPVRRDQPRARTDRHRRHLRGVAADQGGGHQRRACRAGYRPGDEGLRSRLLLPGGPGFARRPARRADARADSPRLFRLMR